MSSRPSLPHDLVTLARHFVELGMDIVMERNAQAGVLDLSVPYRAAADPRIYAYRIHKEGTSVSVCPVGLDTQPCRLTSHQQRQLLDLCATIERRLTDADHRSGADRAAIQT